MTETTDFLVIGSGIAGLSYALAVAPAGRVVVLTKKEDRESATNLAQGGIASVMGSDDNFELHVADTLACGAGLSRRDVVELVVRNGPRLVAELLARGVEFSREQDGGIALGREGGHSRRRIVHAHDHTGQAVEKALLASCAAHPNITVYEHFLAVDLVTVPGGARPRCVGAHALDRKTRDVSTFLAPVTLLATGGAGKVYLYTSNPDICTGDGIAMAYRAGAALANLEFVQFHPTCLYMEHGPRNVLISEAVRGEGAELVDASGRPFTKEHDPRGSLAPRDIVARAVDAEMKRSGAKHVFLDMRPIGADRIASRFPNIHRSCIRAGIDPAREPVPVVPAAHYMCGGVRSDIHGRSDLEGLLVAGEVACTGLHGANRLASNSLLEAPVFADRAAEVARETLAGLDRGAWERSAAAAEPWRSDARSEPREKVMIDHDWDEVRRLMWDCAGIVRSDERLDVARTRLGLIRGQVEASCTRFRLLPDLVELRNIALVSEAIVRSAITRLESRGLHFNVDHPGTDPRFERDTVLDPLES